MNLTPLITAYRAAQFTAHAAHNLVRGPSFFQDHSFLGELYSTYEDAYDSLVERAIGSGDKPDIAQITRDAAESMPDSILDMTSQQFLMELLGSEKEIINHIEDLLENEKLSEGTKNLLQGFADSGESRIYKLNQRTKP